MTNKFLRANHWQIFTLSWGVPILIQLFMTFSAMFTFSEGDEFSSVHLNNFMIFPIIMFITVLATFGWLWSVGIGLQKFVPDTISLKINKFKVFFFIPFAYLLVLIAIIGATFSGYTSGFSTIQDGLKIAIILLFVLLHVFSIICILYLFYFTAKSIKTAELKREVNFNDCILYFLSIWFFPIGIWFMQPRVNNIVAQKNI